MGGRCYSLYDPPRYVDVSPCVAPSDPLCSALPSRAFLIFVSARRVM